MTNPNPNEPNYPYGGGTDNPGDNTAIAGGPTDAQATETAPLQVGASGPAVRFPPTVVGVSQQGTDTPLAPGQVVGSAAAGLEGWVPLRSSDPEGGVLVIGTGSGAVAREAGQDEVAGATEITSGEAPTAFPEPNP